MKLRAQITRQMIQAHISATSALGLVHQKNQTVQIFSISFEFG